MLLYVHFSFAIILLGKRELVALLSLSFWCLVIVVWLFLTVPWVCMQFVIVVFSDLTHLPFLHGFKFKNLNLYPKSSNQDYTRCHILLFFMTFSR